MTDAPDEPGPDRATQLSPVPFVVALVGFVIVAVLALVFLRADNSGELVRPDRLDAVGDATVRAVAFERPPCEEVLRAQVDMADEAVFVELVVDEVDGQDCASGLVDVEAEIDLPDAIGDRPLRAGVGRTQLPCTGAGTQVRCAPEP